MSSYTSEDGSAKVSLERPDIQDFLQLDPQSLALPDQDCIPKEPVRLTEKQRQRFLHLHDKAKRTKAENSEFFKLEQVQIETIAYDAVESCRQLVDKYETDITKGQELVRELCSKVQAVEGVLEITEDDLLAAQLNAQSLLKEKDKLLIKIEDFERHMNGVGRHTTFEPSHQSHTTQHRGLLRPQAEDMTHHFSYNQQASASNLGANTHHATSHMTSHPSPIHPPTFGHSHAGATHPMPGSTLTGFHHAPQHQQLIYVKDSTEIKQKFKGGPDSIPDFMAFRYQFQELYGKLPQESQFFKLQELTEGEAKQKIQRIYYSPSALAYCWDILTDAYGSKALIARYYNLLMRAQAPANDTASLTALYYNVAECVENMTRSGLPVDGMVSDVADKISETYRRAIAKTEQMPLELMTMAKLSESLHRELASHTREVRLKSSVPTTSGQQASSLASTSSAPQDTSFNRSNIQCPFCRIQGHHAVQCRKYQDKDQRAYVANQQKLCFNCLKPGHSSAACPRTGGTYGCRTCHSKEHHTALHGAKFSAFCHKEEKPQKK